MQNGKALPNILNANKEYFAYISKFGKDVDKTFPKEIDNVFKENLLNEDLILNVIFL